MNCPCIQQSDTGSEGNGSTLWGQVRADKELQEIQHGVPTFFCLPHSPTTLRPRLPLIRVWKLWALTLRLENNPKSTNSSSYELEHERRQQKEKVESAGTGQKFA